MNLCGVDKQLALRKKMFDNMKNGNISIDEVRLILKKSYVDAGILGEDGQLVEGLRS